ncbi:hypothetical protein V9T40_008971 [Parthenolecanium corni]|uniref:Uncharacterized protein n=1 Tax=Parthenolecanium corni TaxID=536013 RepID=A0AAN9TLV6_9HEMI
MQSSLVQTTETTKNDNLKDAEDNGAEKLTVLDDYRQLLEEVSGLAIYKRVPSNRFNKVCPNVHNNKTVKQDKIIKYNVI